MTIGLLGKKCGMTRVYAEDGSAVAVTVIEVLPNKVTQVKTEDNDGYNAIQVSIGKRRANRLTKAEAGHYAKAGVEPGVNVHEFRVDDATLLAELMVGTELKCDRFNEGQYIDVTGVTKGKGFAGVIKRHNFATQDATHGNSLSHRAPGSIGQRQTPGRVMKGKRMAGHMGDVVRTVLSQPIVKIDAERNLIMVRGGVPGAENGYVIIRPAIKKDAASA